MTELAVPEENTAPNALAQQAETALLVWATEARQANQIAQSLAMTSFVPSTMRGKVGDVTGAILAGHELGLSPMAALRSIDIIQGTPGLRAHAMRGLVQARGHEIEVVEASERKVVMKGRRRRASRWQTVEWTIERAAKLGLTSKDQWKKQPQTMLIARATGEICRLIAADVLHAMPYATEELDGYSDRPAAVERPEPVQAVTEAPSGPLTMAELASAPAPIVAASADGESLGRAVEDVADITAYEPEPEEPPAEDGGWPVTAAPGSKGGE